MNGNTQQLFFYDEMVNKYLKHLETMDSSPHTIRHYGTTLREFGTFLERKKGTDIMLGDIRLQDLSSYLSYKKEQGTCGRTRRNYIITFRSFWKYLVRHNYTTENPSVQLEDIHVEKKERIYLTVAEMQQFLNVIDRPIIYAACSTICYSGLRISELCQMKLKDVNFTRNVIHVVCGKGKKDRIIPLNTELKQILENYIRYDRNPNSKYLFSSTTSGRLSPQYLNQMIHQYAKKAGVNPQISAHCLRHSFASALVAKGAPITSIQRLLGHTDLKTTNIYMHVDQKELTRTVNLLAPSTEMSLSDLAIQNLLNQFPDNNKNSNNTQDFLPIMSDLKEKLSALYYAYLTNPKP